MNAVDNETKTNLERCYFKNPKTNKLYKFVGLYIYVFKNSHDFSVVISDKFANCLISDVITNKEDYESFLKNITLYNATFIIKGKKIFEIYPSLINNTYFKYCDLDLKYYTYDIYNHRKLKTFKINFFLECFPELLFNNPNHVASSFIRLHQIGRNLNPPIINLVQSVQDAEFKMKLYFIKKQNEAKILENKINIYK